MNQDEWVISRVFQKSLSSTANGGSAVSSASGSKKTNTRMSSSVTMSLYPEPSSPSSIYLPPLLDSSPYAAAANDRDSCSYDGSSTTPREHVSCFSTFSASAAANNLPNVSYELAPPPPLPPPPPVVLDPFARFHNNVGVPAIPSLRSLQENLQLPFLAPAAIGHGGSNGGDMNGWVKPEEQTVVGGGTGMALFSSELDYMWGGY